MVAELQRRRVLRALDGYGIAAFAILQIIEPIMHGLHWPDAVLSYVVVALAVGFPIVVSLAWIFDVNAGRIERTAPAPDGERSRRLLLSSIAGAAVLLAIMLAAVYRRAPLAGGGQGLHTLAVLPLANVSGDLEQEYFVDGMTDALITELAQVSGLRVISRTSSIRYKSAPKPLPQVVKELRADAF